MDAGPEGEMVAGPGPVDEEALRVVDDLGPEPAHEARPVQSSATWLPKPSRPESGVGRAAGLSCLVAKVEAVDDALHASHALRQHFRLRPLLCGRDGAREIDGAVAAHHA